MTGIYRRRIRVEAHGDSARAALEDDPHHFEVALRHDGERVVAMFEKGAWRVAGYVVRDTRPHPAR